MMIVLQLICFQQVNSPIADGLSGVFWQIFHPLRNPIESEVTIIFFMLTLMLEKCIIHCIRLKGSLSYYQIILVEKTKNSECESLNWRIGKGNE